MTRSLLNPRSVTLAGLIFLILGHLLLLGEHLWNVEKFRAHWGLNATSILHYCYAITAFGVIPAAWFLVRLHRERAAILTRVRSWLPVRAWIYSVFLAIAITSAAQAANLFQYSEFLTRTFFETTLVGCLDLWALLVLSVPSLSVQELSRPWRFLDVALANVVLVLLLAEPIVSLWSSHTTSHLPIDATAIEANVAAYRKQPRSRFFNFDLNSGGYHDTEFFEASDKDFAIALLADSFGMGVVPYQYNFATVAEQRLQAALRSQYERVAVHNFGIPGINMPGYALLLHTEVPKTNPTYVVLCVFVGNDIFGLKAKTRRRYIFQNWRLWNLTAGLLTLLRERTGGAHVMDIGVQSPADDSIPEHILEPEKEPPTLSESTFLNIEGRRLEITNALNPATQRRYKEFFNAFGKFESWLGERLIVAVIPDEFQVNDELYQRILATKQNPNDYERTYPQQRLRAYSQEQGIPMLDLLPALRDANKEERVYHLRDTHWNARGNRIAGEAIAEFLLDHLSSSM